MDEFRSITLKPLGHLSITLFWTYIICADAYSALLFEILMFCLIEKKLYGSHGWGPILIFYR